jgi:glycosyltransferase involved in cell wall biosynthesis
MTSPSAGSTGGDGAGRVALVHDWLTGVRGGEKVLEALCRVFPRAPIYTLFHVPGSTSDEIESHPIHTSFLQRAPFRRRHYRSYLPFFPWAIEDFDLGGYDLIVSSSHCAARGVVPGPSARHVCYCHTPMRYAWDQEHAYFPRRRGLRARLRGAILQRLRAWDVSTVPRTDRFLANSHFVAARIRRYYGRRATVVPPPVDVDFFTPVASPPDGETYALCVAALVPYKRLEVAAEACAVNGLELRIVGEGPERRRLERSARGRLRLLGRVSDEVLRHLYRGAAFLLQPGIEDFGIAAVEALACGTPVVAAGAGGVLDIVEHGEHGLLYPPDEGPAGMKEAIDKIRGLRFNPLDLRTRAETFSQSRFDDRMRDVLAGALP